MAAELYLKLLQQVGSGNGAASSGGERISVSDIQKSRLMVTGDGLGDGFEGQIELTDISWALTLEEKADEKPSPGPSVIRLSKPVDISSGKLMSGLNKDTCFPGAIISLIDRTDLGMCVFISLQNIRLVSHSLSVKSSPKKIDLNETWTLRYSDVSIGCTGKYAKGASIPQGFDIKMNDKSTGKLITKGVKEELLEFAEKISKDKSYAGNLKELRQDASELFKKGKLES